MLGSNQVKLQYFPGPDRNPNQPGLARLLLPSCVTTFTFEAYVRAQDIIQLEHEVCGQAPCQDQLEAQLTELVARAKDPFKLANPNSKQKQQQR